MMVSLADRISNMIMLPQETDQKNLSVISFISMCGFCPHHDHFYVAMHLHIISLAAFEVVNMVQISCIFYGL